MRKLVIAAWVIVASFAASVPAVADSPVSLPPVAAGEVLAEVNAVGIVRSPATSATFTAMISVQRATEAETRRAADEAVRRITAAARAAGAAAADIESSDIRVESDLTDVYNMAVDMAVENALGDSPEGSSESYHGSGSVTIQLRNAANGPALQRALRAIDGVNAGTPMYRLDDESAARRGARNQALQNARADAESYAAAMNMRVARVLRVTERTGVDFLGMALSESNTAMRTFRDFERATAEGQVLTFVVVGVDYVLAPQ